MSIMMLVNNVLNVFKLLNKLFLNSFQNNSSTMPKTEIYNSVITVF